MLDERGVQYETYIEPLTGFEHVKWNFNEHGSADFNLEFGEPWLTMYGTISGPEQAIAATLGDADATATRHGDADLKAENAKLRELCAGLWNVMWACAEQRCPHRHEDCFVVNGNGDGPKGHGECLYKRRMRELGVEVDG
jgi:hypothetical protein